VGALGVVVVALAALGGAIGGAGAAWAATQTRVVEASSDRVVVEVLVPAPRLTVVEAGGERFTRITVDGAGSWGEAGKPGVVRMPVLVGVPFGARPTARVLEATTRVLDDVLIYPTPAETVVSRDGLPAVIEVFRWDRAAYEGEELFPAERVRVVNTSRMRHQEIAALEVVPVRARPAHHEVEIASRLLVEVRWDGAGVEKGGGAGMEPPPAGERWESIYRGLLANPEQARAFRARAGRAALPEGGPRKTGARAGVNPEWKLAILETGLYRLPFESLSAKGFPSGIDVDEIRLFQRSVNDSLLWAGADPFLSVEIPLDVVDAGNDGAFGPGDAVYVYLRDFREQFAPGDYEDMFTTRAVYWLTYTPGETGARVAERGGWLGYGGLTPPASFLSEVHFEPDVIFNPDSPSGQYDLWFAVNYRSGSASLGIDLPDVDFGATARFRTQAVGRLDTGSTPHHLAFSANGVPFASFDFTGRVRFTSPDTTFGAAILRNGANTILYDGSVGGDASEGSGAYIDWFEIEYPRLYRARNDRLAFTSGAAAGQSQFHVGSFASADVRLYDVTDPLAPVRVVVDSLVPAGGATEIRFQADVASLRRYEAATPGGARALPDSLLSADTPSSLASDEADHVMIVYDDFESGLAPLVALRQAQGLRVKVARLSDVYDEWNGGMPNPAAIRRYMKYAFERWATPPTYLLLVGDASEDHARRDSRYDIDYVPSFPSYNAVLFLAGSDHWDASDNWYVLLDGPTVDNADFDDLYLDALVGRLSVASLGELSLQVSKTVAYETGDYTEPWRRRFLLMADDAWATEGVVYKDLGQGDFEVKSHALANEINATTSPIDLDATVIPLSDVTDTLHGSNLASPLGCDPDTILGSMPFGPPLGWACVIDGTRTRYTPAIFDSMNAGVLFASYQGHGNRWVLAHEGVILDGFHYIFSGADVGRFQSNGRPSIFMAFGCSISEFERASPEPNFHFDDCLTEKMMNVSNGGAVACIGSSGVEFLIQNLDLNQAIVEALLAGGDESPPRFILGDVAAIGFGVYAAAFPIFQRESMLRYIVFGDPALQIRIVPSSYTVRVDDDLDVPDLYYLGGHRDGSPVRISAASGDSTVLAALRISRSDLGEIDPSLYPVVGDSVHFLHPVEFKQYDVILRAPAVGGGTRTVTLRVDVRATFTFSGREVPDGELVDPASEIAIDLIPPVPVLASDITVTLDGAPVTVSPDSVGPREWRIVLPPMPLADGAHTLEVSVLGLAKTKTFSVQNKFTLYQPLNYPNPMRDETTFFSFILSADVDRVDIAIYTVNGRKVHEMNGLAGRAGYNPAPGDPAIEWDGRDEDGDEMANGVYLYRVRAVSAGRTAEAIGKLVILRK
jgi:hypothetical protein